MGTRAKGIALSSHSDNVLYCRFELRRAICAHPSQELLCIRRLRVTFPISQSFSWQGETNQLSPHSIRHWRPKLPSMRLDRSSPNRKEPEDGRGRWAGFFSFPTLIG